MVLKLSPSRREGTASLLSPAPVSSADALLLDLPKPLPEQAPLLLKRREMLPVRSYDIMRSASHSSEDTTQHLELTPLGQFKCVDCCFQYISLPRHNVCHCGLLFCNYCFFNFPLSLAHPSLLHLYFCVSPSQLKRLCFEGCLLLATLSLLLASVGQACPNPAGRLSSHNLWETFSPLFVSPTFLHMYACHAHSPTFLSCLHTHTQVFCLPHRLLPHY